jgi:phosphoglycerate dehydrogenase-like enzyme
LWVLSFWGRWSSFANFYNFVDISPERLQDVEILLADPTHISKWLSHLPKLKWMQSTFAGVNDVFKQLPQDKPPPSFVLTKLAGVFGPIIAEYVIGHIIARERKFALCGKYQQSKEW